MHELGQMGIGPLLVLQLIDLELIDLEFTGMARHYFVETATAGAIWTCDDNGRLVRQYFCLFVFVLYFCICKTFFCGAGDIWMYDYNDQLVR